MKISLIIEGGTERAFLPHLRTFLKARLDGKMPKIDPVPRDGRIETNAHLQKLVRRLLLSGSDAVIALTDVYTGENPPTFRDAAEAKSKMKSWVGDEPRFHPHASQHDFEAWLLPYWSRIKARAGSNQSLPANNPESVNHSNPPSKRLRELYERGTCKRSYKKTTEPNEILKGQDLGIAISKCPELKALVNTILKLCDSELID